ncbi:GIN domain-containing protein [Flavobacterium seoulense]|uniref:Putative auto-transporter adhesin head GIN domain-containing protein n=1 Tax=Flavobacterium seoulense TaxID=1492738 RepID=A0A066WTL1_9FLAO|nr:DUF2807 domain-containing protein [Flavobacterium seoulense]KDN54314.1 hypothetical protein FEM21_25650 [Flavobacterium seoulense]
MKKISILLLVFLSTTIVFAQKKEKISGSKNVATKQKNIGNFSAIEVEDNFEISLERGEYPEIKIESDDNLMDIIDIEVNDGVLHLSTSKKVTKSKALKIKVTYTAELNSITAKNDVVIKAIQEIQNEQISIKSFDNSKLFINANTKNFTLEADGNSKIELNLKSEKAKIALTKNSEIKSLVTTTDLAFDMYQKTKAKIEGQAVTSTIRLENNAELEASKLEIGSINLFAEGQSKSAVNAIKNINISANEKSEIDLYGLAKIEMKQFIDKAKLSKK